MIQKIVITMKNGLPETTFTKIHKLMSDFLIFPRFSLHFSNVSIMYNVTYRIFESAI